MPDRIVELGSFADEAGAWLARAELEINGIRAAVTEPNTLHIVPGARVRLAVREQDVEEARRILKAMSDRLSA